MHSGVRRGRVRDQLRRREQEAARNSLGCRRAFARLRRVPEAKLPAHYSLRERSGSTASTHVRTRMPRRAAARASAGAKTYSLSPAARSRPSTSSIVSGNRPASATANISTAVNRPGGASGRAMRRRYRFQFGPWPPRRWFRRLGGLPHPRILAPWSLPILEPQATLGRPVRRHRARATRLQAPRTTCAEIYA
jgi:hypothetical protein